MTSIDNGARQRGNRRRQRLITFSGSAALAGAMIFSPIFISQASAQVDDYRSGQPAAARAATVLASQTGSSEYRRGYRSGFREGNRDGWTEAKRDCKREHRYDTKIQSAPDNDYDRGYAEGYDRGFQIGFDRGLEHFC